jgi:hypothetical protein
MRWVVAFAVGLLGACGNNGTGSDAGPPPDARFLSDASRPACSAEMDDCAELAFTRVCDLDRGHCVECMGDVDCAATASLGDHCNVLRGTCECADEADCAGNVNGRVCHPSVHACGCITAEDCKEGQECKLEPYLGTGIRTCRALPDA